MRMPICEECVMGDNLCEECQKKIDNKEVSELDVKLSRTLYKLYQKNVIGDPSFERTIATKDFIIIITRSNVSTLIGKGGRIVRILSDKMGKKVRIVKKGDVKTVINDLIAPARMAGMTTLYTPDEEKQRVLIPNEDRRKILLSEESIKQVLKEICGTNIDIKYIQG